MTRTPIAAALAALTITAGAHAQSPSIAEIAPPNAMFVVGIDNYAQMHEAFDASFLGELWRDQEMKDWIDRLLEDEGLMEAVNEEGGLGESFEKVFDRADMEFEDLTAPAGVTGLAVWWGERADSGEIGAIWTAVLDYGDDDDQSETMRVFVESMIEVSEEEDESIVVTTSEYEGAEVWLIAPNEDHEDPNDIMNDDEWGEWEEFETESPMERLHIGWVENTLVIANDRSAVEHTIDRINGVEMDTLAETGRFADAMRAHQGSQLYLAAFVAPMLDAFVPDAAMIGFDMNPMLDTLGVLDLHSFSAGARFDGAGGALEQTISIIAPEKKGIVALFDNRLDAFRPPTLVSPDANTVTMIGFDWAGIMPLVNQAIAALPDDSMRTQAQGTVGMVAGGVGPMLDGMRDDVMMVSSINRPFSADSKQDYFAFGVRDNDAITGGVNMMGAFFGLEARDFLGNQIWDAPPGFSLGLGFSRLFAGMSEQVEDAMRQAGHNNAAGLADTQEFRNATATLRGGAMAYSFQNNREAYEYAIWSIKNAELIMREQLASYDLDKETIDQIIEDEFVGNPFEEIGFPSVDLVFRHLGDYAVFEMHSTDDGFTGRSIMFAADGDD